YELETVLPERGIKKGIIKRIFSLIIEALQNIRLHGAKDGDGEQASFYFIAKDDEIFRIMTANIIHKDVIDKVQTRIEKINSLDRAGLKEFYMDTLTDGQRSSKGGAGLGFITVAMKAKSKLDCTFEPLDDVYSKFEMFCDLKIKKEEI
ncbi:MAG: SiaB family protein kinase, partial [Flavobacteriales bacterium]|nr:SiaB family protein kinase [Flavobacteriales bacterium]